MSRTYDEMIRSALGVRHAMLKKGHRTEHGKFFVTEHERLVILDRPPFHQPLLSEKRDRICGLKIEVIRDGAPDSAHDAPT